MGNNHPHKYLNSLFTDDPVFPTNLLCSVQTVSQPIDDSGLYDFDIKQSKTNSFVLKNEGFILRSGLDTIFLNDQCEQIVNDQSIALTKIYQTKSGIVIKNLGTEGNSDNDLWIVLKKTEPKTKNPIKVDDQFKLGRIRLRVNEMSSLNQQKKNNQIDYANLQKYSSFANFKSVQACRICLSVEEDSPLIRPCNCTGSVAFIHINCLREWFKNKIQAQKSDFTKRGGVTYYTWKNLECEICTKQYQYNFEVDGLKFQLFDMIKPKGPYILFESLTKDRNSLKGLYLVDMSYTNIIKMGRGQDVDMRLLDISVSREHTLLHYIKGKFYINDAGSKFGTILLIRDQVNLCNGQYNDSQFLSAQTLFSFEMKLKKENLSCFGRSESRKPSTEVKEKNEQDYSFQFKYEDENMLVSQIVNLGASVMFLEALPPNDIQMDKTDICQINDSPQKLSSDSPPSQTSIEKPFFLQSPKTMHNSVHFEESEHLEASGISTLDQQFSPLKLIKMNSDIMDIFEPTEMKVSRQTSHGMVRLQKEPLIRNKTKSQNLEQEDNEYCDEYLKFSRLVLDDLDYPVEK